MGDIKFGDIGDIDQLQCHNVCDRKRNTSMWHCDWSISPISPRCYWSAILFFVMD